MLREAFRDEEVCVTEVLLKGQAILARPLPERLLVIQALCDCWKVLSSAADVPAIVKDGVDKFGTQTKSNHRK